MSRPVAVLRLTPAFDWRVVDSELSDEESIGGLATQVAMQSTATGARGVRQDVLTMALPEVPREAEVGGVRIKGVGNARARGIHRRNLSWLGGVVRELRLRRRGERPDVVHVHASGLFEPLLAAVAARFMLGRPIVLTVHCSAVATYVPQSRRDQIVQVFTRAAERAAVALSARTLTLTRRAAAILGTHAEPMPDWVAAAQFAPGPERDEASKHFASEQGLPADGAVVLFVGRVSYEKGWPLLVRLADELRDLAVHVVVCGDGPQLPELRAELARRGATESFSLVGAVTHADVAAALGCAAVLVLPSAHEELGSVLIEAMAAGVPAVAYDVGGVGEAIEEGVTGAVVPAGDEPALIQAVRRAITDDALATQAAQSGPKRARAEYDINAGADLLVALYEELAR